MRGMERLTASGLAVIEHRQLRPRNVTPVAPNGNDPTSVPPATVGPDVARPGDPDGIEFVASAAAPPSPPARIVPSPWSGWPAEWATPGWGHVEVLTDTAWTCLDLNSSLLSTMPPYLVNASPTLPDEWLDNPDPDLYTSWEEFAQQLFWDYQGAGEVFVLATAWYHPGRGLGGYPARFHVVEPWAVNVERIPGRGRRYAIGGADVTADMLHIRYKSTTSDAHGHGPLEAGRARLVAALVLSRYATNLATSGGVPNAVLKHPDELNDTQAYDLQQKWVEARMSSLGLPAVLSGGIDFEVLQLSPKDMALVELAQLNESRIAVLLGVPPFLVGLPSGGDSMTYSNVEQIFDYHWRAGLRPKAQKVMAAMSGWLTPRGTRIEVNRDAYVQPGPLERAQIAEILNRIRDDDGNPVLTVAQIQASERFTNSAPADLSAGVLR
jgi:HK97 family phage portal protein